MSKELSLLEPVELRDIWETKLQDFTPWLADRKKILTFSPRP